MEIYLISCKPRNWAICEKETIFGLKVGINFSFKPGDVMLMRVSKGKGNSKDYGIRAIWYFEKVDWNEEQYSDSMWTDALNLMVTLIIWEYKRTLRFF